MRGFIILVRLIAVELDVIFFPIKRRCLYHVIYLAPEAWIMDTCHFSSRIICCQPEPSMFIDMETRYSLLFR
jgi:hypothetical protein